MCLKKLILIILVNVVVFQMTLSQTRTHLLFDENWKFALGHDHDHNQDFNHATGHFSYFAKTGYGDGAAAADFDDRAWRVLDLPHDWCVELPFDKKGTGSHGYKAIGQFFPENSIGWYRKHFTVPANDLGKKISIEFDGVFRNSSVWINGFYVGTAQSGYHSFEYDITDYLNYGENNVIAVRVDASMEEGWYYEGAGIYRHVYLNKKHPVHIARNGTCITTIQERDKALISIQTQVENASATTSSFIVSHTLLDQHGKEITNIQSDTKTLKSTKSNNYLSSMTLSQPTLWSLENPYLYSVKTTITIDHKVVDEYTTAFGIRTIKFDADNGFFLNGKHIKIVGVNNHKDHAGVGTALPEALIEWRIKQMKAMGANAIRTAHDPPSPAFLDACDRLGMMVMVENRLSGSSRYHYDKIKDLITQNRNHPSIIMWSLGNEEWKIEGNIKGARITESMQAFAKTLDTTRAFTVAISGGWDSGTGTVVDVMGYNYIVHGDIDEHHKKFPWQPSIGTEETTTRGTRGIYETKKTKCHLQVDLTDPEKPGCEYGWNFYNNRKFLSGIFYWTGFDYRGEPTPYEWPAVTSQFGITDLCGFPKDPYFYLQSWWLDEPVIHLWPHWNWDGDEGKKKTVTVYSNCEEIELFLNKKSLGRKTMPRNGHLEWLVTYVPGKLTAQGYTKGKKIISKSVETSSDPYSLSLKADKTVILSDNQDVAIITVEVLDKKRRPVPTANIDLKFDLEGPGKIIGVGNGNPSSHEPERYFETITTHAITDLKEWSVERLENRKEVQPEFDDSDWNTAFDQGDIAWNDYRDTLLIVRGTFDLPEISDDMVINLFAKSIVYGQSIYINGQLIKANIKKDDPNQSFELDHNLLKTGKNVYVVTGKRFKLAHWWEEPNEDPGLIQIIRPAAQWERKTFNGLAQVIVQSTHETGRLTLKISGEGVKDSVLELESK